MATREDARGGLPALLGVRLTEFSPGRLGAEMQVKPDLLTPIGNMHGGALAALCDHVLVSICYPQMMPGQWTTAIEYKIEHLIPVREGVVAAEAEIVSRTRETAVVHISVENKGRLVCMAQGTVLILGPKP